MLQQGANLRKEISQDLIMNRAERRKKERQQKKQPVQEPVQSFNINYELFRPWADVIMQAKLPPMILDKMIEISDKIIEGEE